MTTAVAAELSAMPANEMALIPTPDGGHSYFKIGGTEELHYSKLTSFSDLPEEERTCTSIPPAFVLATDADGQSSWAGMRALPDGTDAFGNNAFTVTLDETGMRYPGGDLTLTYFSKTGNDIGCSSMADPSDPNDTSGLVSYKTSTLTVDWQRPEIKDVYLKKDSNGDDQIHFEVDDLWVRAEATPSQGGLSIFEIENFGDPRTQKVRTTRETCQNTEELDRDGLTCKYRGATPSVGNALGVAALPAGYDLEKVTNWPPVDAITFREFVGTEPVAVDPQMTQAGPSDSAQCHKLCAGDPVDTHNGNFYEEITDLDIDGRIGLEATRRYATGLLGTAGAHGDGWALNYDMRVEQNPTNNSVTVVEPSGNVSRFVKGSTGYTGRAANLRADLRKTSEGWEFSRWDDDLAYVFDEAGLLVSVEDGNANAVTVAHDSEGHVSSVVEGDRSLSFAWNGDLLASVEDHTGRKVSYGYADDRMNSVTGPDGSSSEYTYDGDGRVLTMTNASGGVTTNVYDAEGRISRQTQPNGQALDFAYGALSNGKRTNTVASGSVVKTYVYDEHGRILSFEDTSDPTVRFARTYDSSSNVVTEQVVDGFEKSFTHAYANGDRVKTTEANAKSTVLYEYDGEHRLTASVDAAGIRTEHSYDDRGSLVQTRTVPNDGGAPRVTTFEVDAEGDVVAVTNPLGGRTELGHDPAGQLVSVTDPVGAVTTNNYDSLGRLASTVAPGGNIAGITVEERSKFTTSYAYDAAGNVLEVTEQSGTTAYQYDAQGNPTSVVDPRGKAKSVVYDPSGRPTKVTYPDGSTDEFAYDPATGLRASWKDPQGLTTTYSYENGAVTTKAPDGAKTTLATEIDWDSVDTVITNSRFPSGHAFKRQTATTTTLDPDDKWSTTIEVTRDAAGRMTIESQNYNEVAYAYDGFGQLASRTGQGRDVSYAYDLAGNVTKTVYADGTEVLHEADLAGRTTGITSWDGTTYDLSYTTNGQLASMSSGTGLGFTTEHDGTRLNSKAWKSAAGAQLKSFGYRYEASGLMSSDRIDETERDFAWSDNGALSSVNQDPIIWDGRLLTSTGVRDLAYDAATGRLSQMTEGTEVTSYEYDAQGNRAKSVAGSTETTYAWNGLNQLTRLDDTAFSYGADGIRTKVGSAVQNYGQDLKLLSDGEKKYLWSPDGSLLAQAPLNSTSKTDTQQAITDALGSVHTVLDEQLSPVGEYSYTVFGERTLTAGADTSSIGFASEQHDDSGLVYLRYRYLDPTVGQFISVDPLAGVTLDPYGYASGNPLQLTDPLGLLTADQFWGPLYEHSSEWSMWMGGLAAASHFIPGLNKASDLFTALSIAFGVTATYKSFSESDVWGGLKNGIATAFAGAAALAKPLALSDDVAGGLSVADNTVLGMTYMESEVC
ncbi:RHS repeat-associated core domain-containing protein [Leucobacter chromiiresistens]